MMLDEATSSLGQSEVGWLARLVRRLRDADRVILFISHRWDEITTFCDKVVVMRNGRLVEVADCAAMSQDRAVKLMTGRDTSGGFPPKAAPRSGALLDVRDLEGRMLSRISLALAPGEILGLGGLVGPGQTELLRALFAAPPLRSGSIRSRDNRSAYGDRAPRSLPGSPTSRSSGRAKASSSTRASRST